MTAEGLQEDLEESKGRGDVVAGNGTVAIISDREARRGGDECGAQEFKDKYEMS